MEPIGRRAPHTPLRLHLTPTQLGRALRDLAPVYAGRFPLMPPLEAALVVFSLQVLTAVEETGGPDLVLHSSVSPG